MPRRVEKAISLPELNKLIYELLKSMPSKQKKELPEKYLKAVRDEKGMRDFSEHAPLDKQIEMLSILGLDFAMVFAPNPELAALAVMNSSEQYENDDFRMELIEAMKREKVFILHSADIATKLFMTSQNSQTLQYSMSNVSSDLVRNFADFKKLESFSTKLEKVNAAHTLFTNMVLTTLNSENILEVIDLDKIQMRILLALFVYRNSAITLKTLLDVLKYKKYSSSMHLDDLVDMGLVAVNGKGISTGTMYLTTNGRKKVFEYMDFVLVHTFQP